MAESELDRLSAETGNEPKSCDSTLLRQPAGGLASAGTGGVGGKGFPPEASRGNQCPEKTLASAAYPPDWQSKL